MEKQLLVFGIAVVLALTACSSTVDTTQPAPSADDDDTSDTTQTDETTTEDTTTGKDAPEEPVDSTGSEDVKEVSMTARQFEFEPSTVQVEKGRPVRLNISSTDVPHGIGIPAFGVSERLPVGEAVTVEFTPDQTGTFDFICSVYCGSGHSSMTGTLVVE